DLEAWGRGDERGGRTPRERAPAADRAVSRRRAGGQRISRKAGINSASLRLSRPAHRDAVHAQGRLADTDGHPLAILAASANAGIELEVVSDHADTVEIGRAVADQHGAFERPAA